MDTTAPDRDRAGAHHGCVQLPDRTDADEQNGRGAYETLAQAVDDLGATATVHHDELVAIKAYIEELEAQLPDETVAKETLPQFQALPPKATVRIPPNLDQAIRLKKQQQR